MRSHFFLFGSLQRRRPPEFTAILMFEFWREATAASVPGLLCQSNRLRPENVSILSSLFAKDTCCFYAQCNSMRLKIIVSIELKYVFCHWGLGQAFREWDLDTTIQSPPLPWSVCAHTFLSLSLQQLLLFTATIYFICCNYFFFAATTFYLQQLYLICSNFFICSMSPAGHRKTG